MPFLYKLLVFILVFKLLFWILKLKSDSWSWVLSDSWSSLLVSWNEACNAVLKYHFMLNFYPFFVSYAWVWWCDCNCVTRQQSYYAGFRLKRHDSLDCYTRMSYTLLLLHFIAVNYNIRSLFKVLWSRNHLCLAELLSNLSFKEATALFIRFGRSTRNTVLLNFCSHNKGMSSYLGFF